MRAGPRAEAAPKEAAMGGTVRVLDVPVSRLNLQGILAAVSRAVETPGPSAYLIAYSNAHTCNLARSDSRFRQALGLVDLIYVDGNGPRVAAWLAGDWLPRRMTGADWIDDLCRLAIERSYSLYFVGAAEGVSRKAAARLTSLHPGLQVRGSFRGYFDPTQEAALVADIRRVRPDILLVGMASPAQEEWMVNQGRNLGVPVVWGVGALFDYASGELRRAPRWMRAVGLEWLGRLLIEPKRLAIRYLVGLPVFLARAAREGLARRMRPAGEADSWPPGQHPVMRTDKEL